MMTKTLLVTALVGMATGMATADTIANSSSDFAVDQLDGSLQQGFNGWYYGGYNGNSDNPWTSSDFEEMNIVDDFGGSVGQSYTGGTSQWLGAGVIDPGYGWRISWLHPNGPTTTAGKVSDRIDAVRRWVSYVDGPITISGHLAHRYSDASLGDGAQAMIYVDGIEVYSHHVDAGDFNGFGYSFDVDLTVGSIVDFVVTAGGSSDFDTILFNSDISNAVPAPAGLALIGLGGVMGFRRRR